MKQCCAFIFLFYSFAIAFEGEGESVEGDVQDLVEMVPFEGVMALGMEYAIRDHQVKHFLYYLNSPSFKLNVIRLETSPHFDCAADFVEKYNVDLYSLANKVNHALDIPLLRRNRTRRSPGEGVLSFVQDVVEMTPLDDIKEVYRYKMEKNHLFKELMGELVGGVGRDFLESMAASVPLQDTKRDLTHLGIPLERIIQYIRPRVRDFLDISTEFSTLSVEGRTWTSTERAGTTAEPLSNSSSQSEDRTWTSTERAGTTAEPLSNSSSQSDGRTWTSTERAGTTAEPLSNSSSQSDSRSESEED